MELIHRTFIIIYVKMLSNKCLECSKVYTDVDYKWCKPCQINHLKKNFTNWTSKNEQIDKLIQEKQLSINYFYDTIFEWIPYNLFNNIKELNNTTHSAKWKNGPLFYDYYRIKYIRHLEYKTVIFKCLVNSQNINNVYLNEVGNFSINFCFQIFSMLLTSLIDHSTL
jgi:hypothetical protein